MRPVPLLDITSAPYSSYREYGDRLREVRPSGKAMDLLTGYFQHGSNLRRPRELHN